MFKTDGNTCIDWLDCEECGITARKDQVTGNCGVCGCEQEHSADADLYSLQLLMWCMTEYGDAGAFSVAELENHCLDGNGDFLTVERCIELFKESQEN